MNMNREADPIKTEDYDGPCYCRHFYARVYDRNFLTRDDHVNLLATPKGYRWTGPDGDAPRIRKRGFKSRIVKRKETSQKQFPSFRKFMVEIWSIMTPEIIQSLKSILEEEFGMSPSEAIQFLMAQKKKAERLADLEEYGHYWVSDEDIDWAGNMSRVIARKLIQFTEMCATAKRNHRWSVLHKNMVQAIRRTLGIQPGDDSPLKRLLGTLADGLSVWLSSVPGESSIRHLGSDLISIYSSVSLI